MSEYKTMDFYIEEFANYLSHGIQIGETYSFKNNKTDIKHILLVGLGGSGIGAEVVLNYIERTVTVPVVVGKDYFIPGFVNENTLVIACSYSGNTEEALTAVAAAKNKAAKIVCITSGGKMKSFAEENAYDCMILPTGIPPRACISCSLTPILFVLHQYEIISNAFIAEIEHTAVFLKNEVPEIKNQSQKLAKQLLGKLPIIYSDQRISSIGTRWRQQFNENSKILGWERAFPEMNHNELVGWKDLDQQLAVIFLHTGDEIENVQKRFEIAKEIALKSTNTVIDIYAKGNTFFEKAMYLVLLGDWTSWYLAELRGVDAVEVNVINYLKASLEK